MNPSGSIMKRSATSSYGSRSVLNIITRIWRLSLKHLKASQSLVCTLMVWIAVKTTLLVEIVIERNLPEKLRLVSLLNMTAPPYLQLENEVWGGRCKVLSATCCIPQSWACSPGQGCSQEGPGAGEAESPEGWEPGESRTPLLRLWWSVMVSGWGSVPPRVKMYNKIAKQVFVRQQKNLIRFWTGFLIYKEHRLQHFG